MCRHWVRCAATPDDVVSEALHRLPGGWTEPPEVNEFRRDRALSVRNPGTLSDENRTRAGWDRRRPPPVPLHGALRTSNLSARLPFTGARRAPMNAPWWIRFALVAVGALLMFRAVILVTVGSAGRFRGDVWYSVIVAFALFFI